MSNRILEPILFLCLLLSTIGCGGGGGAAYVAPPTPPPVQTEPPAQWVSYVRAQAQPLQSIDPANTDYSDLAFLAPLLQGRTIVELGESGHGVAEFSQAKIRLIKYLHEQLGYDVMAFESSILSTYLANEQANQLTPTTFMHDSIFAVWSTTNVVQLFSYIQSTQNTAHPLILTGFDVQLTTSYELNARPAIFQEVVAQVDPVYAQQVHDMDQTFALHALDTGQFPYILANYSDLKTKYQALTTFLDANMTQLQSAYPTRPLFPLVVRQAAWGMSAYLDEMYDDASSNQFGSLSGSAARDAGMATNLEMLVDNLYAGKKVIVWAHNCHIAHDASVVYRWGWKNTGNWIFQKYGQLVYTLGLYMYQGSADWNDRTVYTISPAPDNSVEGLLHAAGDPYVFLDFSNVTVWDNDTAWMFQNFRIRDWGYYDSPLTLKDEYDGLLQIDTVHPPTYVN